VYRRRERGGIKIEKWNCAAGGEERDWIRKSREEGQVGFSKGVCVISGNCRDLFVKPKFPVDLKPE
jgi:hypothetical protein